LEGPAVSEEASQHPVLFDTLEYRQQDPERELFLKYLRGGQAPILPAGRRKLERRASGRPADRSDIPPQGGRIRIGSTLGTGWGKPQGGRIPGEPGRRLHRRNPVADVPTGRRMKPLKRGRRDPKSRCGFCSRTIDDPGYCRSVERPLRQEVVKRAARFAEGRYPRR